MDKRKCPTCGLVNLATDESCRRCQASLAHSQVTEPAPGEEQPEKRGLLRRLTWIIVASSILIFAFYLSLFLTSNDLGFQQREVVAQAINILEQKGFGKEAFVV